MPNYSLGERIRTRLLLDQPFFGALAMHLNLVEDVNIATAGVNNVELRYNPKFVGSLSQSLQRTLFAHEISHVALMHLWRIGGRDMARWNEACDYVINLMLKDAGFEAIPNWLYNTAYAGMSAEQVYALLQNKQNSKKQGGKTSQQGQPSQDNGGQGDQPSKGAGDPSTGSFGAPVASPASASGEGEGQGVPQEAVGSESHWQNIVEQARRVASAAGTMPGSASKEIAAAREPKVDWRQETKDFLVRNAPSDYCWAHPNRRYVSQDIYLPGVRKENVGPLVVVVDSSASTIPFLQMFADELSGVVAEVQPEKVYVLYVDTRVANVDEFDAGDNVVLNIRGFGGTYFQPAFQWVEDQQIQPVGLIYLTDLDCADKPQDPGYPVLWGVPEFCNKAMEFGQVIPISMEDQ